jgi:regulation of enolase protein 1 (concanavalin A-like superfamily)
MPLIGQSFWRNEPPFHERRGETLLVRTGLEGDYWNNTFYGFRHTNGHFLATPVTGDFSIETTLTADYTRLYDQAGLMVYADDNNWMKCGVEFTDGALHLSVVVTRDDQSDWSMSPVSSAPDEPVTLRVTRHAEALRVQVLDGTVWRLVRLAFLSTGESVETGPMACSPLGEGLEVTFSRIAIGEAISRDLHG